MVLSAIKTIDYETSPHGVMTAGPSLSRLTLTSNYPEIKISGNVYKTEHWNDSKPLPSEQVAINSTVMVEMI